MASDAVGIEALIAAMDEFAYDSIGVLTETESTFNANLLEVLNQLYADRVAMSISMEATIDQWAARYGADVLGTASGSNLRVWVLFMYGDMQTEMLELLAANHSLSEHVFLTNSQVDNYRTSIPDECRVVYVRERVADVDAFEARWQADLPESLRENSPLRYLVGNGSTAASRETFQLHSWTAYAYDATWALAKAVHGAVYDRGAYNGTLDGYLVADDLRARAIPDAATGPWLLDDNGDIERTFEVVHCRPVTGGRLVDDGCEVVYHWNATSGLVAAVDDPDADIPPDRFAPSRMAPYNSVIDGDTAVSWSFDVVADLRGAAVEDVRLRSYEGGAFQFEASLGAAARSYPLATLSLSAAAVAEYNATCVRTSVETSGGDSAWSNATCELCHAGYELTAGETCGACAPGFYSEKGGVCEPCAVGSYSAFRGATVCDFCVGAEFQPLPGQAACEACPRNSYRDLSLLTPHTLESCACVEGSYAPSVNATGMECLDCPSYGECPGGTAPPQPKKGAYGYSLNQLQKKGLEPPIRYALCEPGHCTGGYPANGCERGFEGKLCERPVNDEYFLVGEDLFSCPDNDAGMFLLYGVVLALRRAGLEPSIRRQWERPFRRERFGRASSTRREPSIRPNMTRIDVDATELESCEVWRGPPEPAVDSRAGALDLHQRLRLRGAPDGGPGHHHGPDRRRHLRELGRGLPVGAQLPPHAPPGAPLRRQHRHARVLRLQVPRRRRPRIPAHGAGPLRDVLRAALPRAARARLCGNQIFNPTSM